MRVHPTDDSGLKMSSRSFPPKTKLSVIDILDPSVTHKTRPAKSSKASLTPEHDPAVENINENAKKHSVSALCESARDHFRGHTKSKLIKGNDMNAIPDDRVEKDRDSRQATIPATQLPLPPPLDLDAETRIQQEEKKNIFGPRPQSFRSLSKTEPGTNENNLKALRGTALLPPRRRLDSDPIPPKKQQNDTISNSASSSSIARRSIFGQYWKKDAKVLSATPLGTVVTANNTGSDSDVDLRLFSPPEDRKDTLSPHFSRIEEYTEVLNSSGSLPPVPTPLRRYCSDGPLGGGVYPMMSPKPILRSSSYGQNKTGGTTGGSSSNCARTSSDESIAGKSGQTGMVGMEITKSPVLNSANFGKRAHTASLLSGDSDSSSSGRRGVQFDPRVTITQYDDDDRIWFTDEELSMFKYEATRLAQRYMLSNPQVAQYFRRGRKDAVTGRVRPRALYTNPVFSANGDSSFDEDDSKEMRDLVEKNIKSVLIVDPNTAILNLFCKSIQQLFPLARIAAVQNGEDALRIISMGLNERKKNEESNNTLCFDLIIVEERLIRRQRRGSVQLAEVTRMQVSPSSSLPSDPSREEEKSRQQGMSGSQLIKRIVHLAKQSSKGSIFGTISPPAWTPLLVGVSAYLDEDRNKLLEGGTDILWGKPPPKMDIALRNHLLRAIVNKRTADYS
mmetsp:Transcript_4717/g.7001  ORF Transcript_4717/g.7001 Transcript_4717/m.7001 type:complete len:675 (+) Transcript_4717:44-2068(+)